MTGPKIKPAPQAPLWYDIPETKTCPDCKGRGTCGKCHGKPGNAYNNYTCDRCASTGHCPRCCGTGEVER